MIVNVWSKHVSKMKIGFWETFLLTVYSQAIDFFQNLVFWPKICHRVTAYLHVNFFPILRAIVQRVSATSKIHISRTVIRGFFVFLDFAKDVHATPGEYINCDQLFCLYYGSLLYIYINKYPFHVFPGFSRFHDRVILFSRCFHARARDIASLRPEKMGSENADDVVFLSDDKGDNDSTSMYNYLHTSFWIFVIHTILSIWY